MIDLWVGLVILFSFGVIYNIYVINRMNSEDAPRHPLTAIQVIIGVAVTIGVAWLIEGNCINVIVLLLCFAASGAPMTVGDWYRWWHSGQKTG